MPLPSLSYPTLQRPPVVLEVVALSCNSLSALVFPFSEYTKMFAVWVGLMSVGSAGPTPFLPFLTYVFLIIGPS